MSYKFAQKALIILIPIFGVFFFLFYTPNTTENKRADNSNEEVEESFESRLSDEEQFPVEIVQDDITELSTEILAESESDDDREVVEGDNITVHYRGWTATDGNIFDQSFNRGDAGFTFIIGEGVIDGWSKGLIDMKQGEVRRLYIPSDQAYGEAGSGTDIPPNSDLIFDVELIRFN